MLNWLGVRLESDDPVLLDAVETATHDRLTGGGLWDNGSCGLDRGTGFDSEIEAINISMFFESLDDRTSFIASLRSIEGFIESANVKGSTSWQDDLLPNGAPRYKDKEVIV